jgi:hypothetical protein
VNQHLKRDRLPSAAALRFAHERVVAWWHRAYMSTDGPALPRRFLEEARASLPALAPSDGTPDMDEIYAAVGMQRLRLQQDQQVPEWTGALPGAG